MILSRGHTGQIKGLSLLDDYDFLAGGAIKWPHAGIRYFLISIDLYLSERNLLYTGKSPL